MWKYGKSFSQNYSNLGNGITNVCFEGWLLTGEWLYFDLDTVTDFYHLRWVIDSFNSLLK